MKKTLGTIAGLVLACCVWMGPANAQDYKNSIASTDFDYIHGTDPSAFERLEFIERRDCEMPDKRQDDRELMQPAFVFVASFSDGTSIELHIDAAFETKEAAQDEAKRYVPRLGKLPTTLRQGVRRLVVHQGGKDTTAFSDVGLIVVYSENATRRISNHDLEETIFHESVHASWDKQYASSEAWRRAQAQDGRFVTVYASENPAGEDLAESALFAYTLTHHPGRIPAADARKIKKAIPSRIIFVAELIPPNKPIFYQVAEQKADTDGSAEADTKAAGQDEDDQAQKPITCRVDISRPGLLGDILSNALTRKFDREEKAVNGFLAAAQRKAASGEELFKLTLAEFKLDQAELKDAIVEFLHCNCTHKQDPATDERVKRLLEDWNDR